MHTGRLNVNPGKNSKKDGDNSTVAILKDVPQLVCVFQETEPLESSTILRKSTSLRTNSTSAIHKNFTAFCKPSEKAKVRR